MATSYATAMGSTTETLNRNNYEQRHKQWTTTQVICCILTIIFTHYKTITAYTIHQIDDGVLTTGPLALRAEGAWTVLVTIEEPQLDQALPDAISELRGKLDNYNGDGILSEDINAWKFRLARAESLLTEITKTRVKSPTKQRKPDANVNRMPAQ